MGTADYEHILRAPPPPPRGGTMGKKDKSKGPPSGGGSSVHGGVSKPGKGKEPSGSVASGGDPSKKSEKGGGDFDLDALFSKGKQKKAKTDAALAAAEAARVEKEGPTERARVLLPGQKKPKQQREKPEFTPVNVPRRFEDGLPVYKSYGDFSDVSCGQVAPKNGKPGKCPFECWCCF